MRKQRLSVSDSLPIRSQQRVNQSAPYFCRRRCDAQKIARKSFNSAPGECARPRLPIVYRYTRLRIFFQWKSTTALVIVPGTDENAKSRRTKRVSHSLQDVGKRVADFVGGAIRERPVAGVDLKKKSRSLSTRSALVARARFLMHFVCNARL